MDNGRDVLVVEDDAELNALVGAYVELAGFRYRSALDGESALREIEQHHPALVILDLMLPDIDGFQVCRQLKSTAQTAKIPIMMLTALAQEESRRRGMQCGAVDYMTKPFDPDDLVSAIRSHARGNGKPL